MWRQLLDDIGKKASVYNGIQRMVGSERVWNGFIQSCQTTIDQWSPSEVWLDLGCGTAEVLERLPKIFPIWVSIAIVHTLSLQKTNTNRDPIPFLSVQTGTTHSGTHY